MLRRVIILSVVIVCSVFHMTAQTSGSVLQRHAEITFDTSSHDFGTIKIKDAPRVYEFRFTNTGDVPLIITRTEQSCKCISVAYPRKPLSPGESGAIKVTYTPKNELGSFDNVIMVFSNAADRRVMLNVQGKVVSKAGNK